MKHKTGKESAIGLFDYTERITEHAQHDTFCCTVLQHAFFTVPPGKVQNQSAIDFYCACCVYR